MCKFLSAIVLKNGDLLCDPQNTDSHEDLLQINNIKDIDKFRDNFARIEFVPPNEHPEDLSKWNLEIDEQVKPDWLDEVALRIKLEDFVRPHIVSDKRPLLLGGWWILVGNAKVEKVKNANIKSMHNSSQVGTMYDSSQVGTMHGSSQIGTMHDSSQVGTMYDSSQIGTMYDSSQVGNMYHSSQVGHMCNFSQIITNNSDKQKK